MRLAPSLWSRPPRLVRWRRHDGSTAPIRRRLQFEVLEERLTPTGPADIHPIDYTGVLPFHIIPEEASLTVGFSALGLFQFQEQFPGSRTTRFLDGDLQATFGSGSIAILGTNIDLEENPQNAQPLGLPADLSYRLTSPFALDAAIRDALVEFSISSLLQNAPGALTANLDTISTVMFTGGTLDSLSALLGGLIVQPLDGLILSNLTGSGAMQASVTNDNGVFVLTLPFSFTSTEDILGVSFSVTASGQIKAFSDPIEVHDGILTAALQLPPVNYTPVSSATIQFSEAIQGDEATDPANYTLLYLGPNGVVGGGDDQFVPFIVVHDANANTVTLQFAPQIQGTFQLSVHSGGDGIRTPDGRTLDGDGDGIAGDDLVVAFAVDAIGPSVSEVEVTSENRIQVYFQSTVDLDASAAGNLANYGLFGRNQIGGLFTDVSTLMQSVTYSAATKTATIELRSIPAALATTGFSEFELRLGPAIDDVFGRPIGGDTSPIVPLYPAIAGTVFLDADANTVQSGVGETGFANVRVYIDADGNNHYDPSERSTRTDSAGRYTFYGLSPGSYPVRIERPGIYEYSTPANGTSEVFVVGHTLSTLNFGLFEPAPISVAANAYQGQLNFQILSDLSFLSIQYTFEFLGGGVFVGQDQFPGSQTTWFDDGTLQGFFASGFVQLIGTQLALGENTQPSIPFLTPANLSTQIAAIGTYLAARDLRLSFSQLSAMTPDPLIAQRSYLSSLSELELEDGVLDIQSLLFGNGPFDVTGILFSDPLPAQGSIRTYGDRFALTLPFTLTVGNLFNDPDVQVTTQITGQIVALSDPIAFSPPTVVALELPAVSFSPVSRARLAFSEAVIAAEALDPSNYTLLNLGANGVLGGGDDEAVPFTVSYDGESLTATLQFAEQNSGAFLVVARSGPSGLRTADGRELDGNGNGVGGDDFQAFFAVDALGPSIEAVGVVGGNSIEIRFESTQLLDASAAGTLSNYGLFGRVASTGEYTDLSLLLESASYSAGTKTATLRLRALPTAVAATEFSEFEVRLGSAIDDILGRTIHGETSPAAALYPAIAGTVFDDVDGDRARGDAALEPGIGNVVVYIDQDNDLHRDIDEIWTRTDAQGRYTFYGISAGQYHVRIEYEPPPDRIVTTPAGGDGLVQVFGASTVEVVDFGLREETSQEVYWTGLGDGLSWTDRNNWDLRIPTSVDHVFIDVASDPTIVIDGAGVQVRSLSSKERIEARTTVFIEGDLTVLADLEARGAIVAGGLADIVGSVSILAGGSLQVQGPLTVIGNLGNAGLLAAGGAIFVTGNYEQTGLVSLNPTVNDPLTVVGQASLGGTLQIVVPANFTAALGATYSIVRASDVAGSFQHVVGDAINAGQRFAVLASSDEVRLVVVKVPGITDVFVPEDSADSVLDLDAAFQLASVVGYEVIGNSVPGIVEATIEGGLVRLRYAANAFGTTAITVRATTVDGITVDASYRVTVFPVNDAPTVESPVSSIVAAADPSTPIVIPLDPVFADIEDSDALLQYTIVSISDGTLFRSATILSGPGRLQLVAAADAFGQAVITIGARDRDGGTVQTSFLATIGTPGAPDRLEPNNSLGQAVNVGTVPLGALRTTEANVNQAGDVDVYRFALASNAIVQVQAVAGQLGGSLDSAIEILDAAGNRVGMADDTVGRDPSVTQFLTTGVYYVRVTGVEGTTGAYRLSINTYEPAPRILRMTPRTTVSSLAGPIELFLDDFAINDLNPATVVPGAFRLLRLEGGGIPVDVSGQIVGAAYDAAANRIQLTLAGPLSNGRYQLTARDTLQTPDGRALDGDNDGHAGGDFVGEFAVDSSAPTGTFTAQAAAGGSAAGVFYRFGGTVMDSIPALSGERIRVQLDVDGDGFDDGEAVVAVGEDLSAAYSIVATTPIAGGVGLRTVRARFVDSRGNASAPLLATIDTNLATVATVRTAGADVLVTFNVGGLLNADNPNNYGVTGRAIESVTYDDSTRTARLRLAGGDIADGSYTVTILSGPDGLRTESRALDGDGDLTPGGDFARTIVVDTVEPTVTSVELAASSATLPGQNVTSDVFPIISIVASDIFPSTATGAITVQFDVDGDGFDDGEEVFVLSGDNVDADGNLRVQLAPTIPLREGQVTVLVNVLDANGNPAGVRSVTILVDRTGPGVIRATTGAFTNSFANGASSSVVQTTVTQLASAVGEPVGIAYVIDFDEPLLASVARNLDNYRLLGAGGDRVFNDFNQVAASSLLRVAFDEADPTRIQVFADLAANGFGDDLYRLVLTGRGITDVAGNGLRAGDFAVDFDYSTRPPQVVDARLEAGFVGAAPNRVLVQFTDVDLESDSASNLAHYSLVTVGGVPIALASAVYDRFADRVLLATSPLSPGTYRLTVSGVTNTSGVAQASRFEKTFVVAGANPEVVLNANVLQGNADSFDARVRDALPLLRQSIKDLTREDFTDRLRREIFVSAALGDDVNARVRELFASEQAAEFGFRDLLPPEFVIVWGSHLRFLLFSPTDDPSAASGRSRLGFDLSGSALREIGGAVLVGDPAAADGISLAILPLELAARLIGDRVTTVAGAFVEPNLVFQVEVEAVGDNPLGGVVYFGSSNLGAVSSEIELRAPASGIDRVAIDASDILEGFDPNIRVFTSEILAGLVNVLGPLEALTTNLLVLWFDPVDFILGDAVGRNTGDVARTGQQLRQAAGSFYSIAADGLTELLVIPNALANVYDLQLFGLGESFRGEAVFLKSGSALTSTRLQGLLGSLDNVVAQLDFGYRESLPRTVPPTLATQVVDTVTQVVTATELRTRLLLPVLTNLLIGGPLVGLDEGEGLGRAEDGTGRVDGESEGATRTLGSDSSTEPSPEPKLPTMLQGLLERINIGALPVSPEVLGGVGQLLQGVAPAVSAFLAVVQYLRSVVVPPSAKSAPAVEPTSYIPPVDWGDLIPLTEEEDSGEEVCRDRCDEVDEAVGDLDLVDLALAGAAGVAVSRIPASTRRHRRRFEEVDRLAG